MMRGLLTKAEAEELSIRLDYHSPSYWSVCFN